MKKVRIFDKKVTKIRVSKIRVSKIRVSEIRVTEIRVSKIRVSEIRVTEIHLSEIRVSKIRISSNHRELHGAIFSLPGQLFFLYLVKGYQNQLPWSSAFQNCCWNCSISLSF